MDTSGADTAPFYEAGQGSPNQVGGMGNQEPKDRIYRRRQIISFVTSPRGFLDGTPDTYVPGDAFHLSAKKGWSADYWSVAAVAIGLPFMSEVTTTVPTLPGTEARWLQNKYIEVVLEQAWMEMSGLIEAGAETPWEDAAAFIEDILEPTVIETTAARLQGTTMQALAQLTWDISVPGRRKFNVLSAAG